MALTEVNSLGIKNLEVKTEDIAADAIEDTKIADNAVKTEHITNGHVTIAKLATGTDGQIITWDASGAATVVGPGTDGQVLTSTGAGSPPAFEAIPTPVDATKTTLTGSTNNTITTVTGANAIQGEANLTFDGTNILEISSSYPRMRIKNTGTSASADDIFGAIEFEHSDTDDAGITAKIQAVAEDTAGNSYLAFYNGDGGNADERLRIDSSGDVKVVTGSLIIGTAGKGIDFSAQTQSSSTTDDELLDHYEKGKWTPDVRKNNVSNATPTITHGRYIRVGKLCWLSCYVRWNSGSSTQSSGGWTIHGLPFTLQDDDPGTCRIYQAAPAGYMMIDDTNYSYADNPRWQINTSTYFDLYTDTSSSDQEWNSGMMIVSFTGCFMIHE